MELIVLRFDVIFSFQIGVFLLCQNFKFYAPVFSLTGKIRNEKIVLQNYFPSTTVAKSRWNKGLYGFNNLLKAISNLYNQNLWPYLELFKFYKNFSGPWFLLKFQYFYHFIKENAQGCEHYLKWFRKKIE